MLSNKQTIKIYCNSELFAKKKLLFRFFLSCGSNKYSWNNNRIEVNQLDNMVVIKFPILDIVTYDEKIDTALLNIVDQVIALYEEYQDKYDSDSDNILNLIESLLIELDQRFQMVLDNTYHTSNYKISKTSSSEPNIPKYAYV